MCRRLSEVPEPLWSTVSREVDLVFVIRLPVVFVRLQHDMRDRLLPHQVDFTEFEPTAHVSVAESPQHELNPLHPVWRERQRVN